MLRGSGWRSLLTGLKVPGDRDLVGAADKDLLKVWDIDRLGVAARQPVA